jgi:hypothetical protein
MTEQIPGPGAWNTELEVLYCGRCRWSFLAASGARETRCPHCHQSNLAPIPEGLAELPHPYPPELVVPFSVPGATIEASILHFSKGIPYPPEDLNPSGIQAHLTPIYLPLWLVDVQVNATWQAEAGFDYKVVSHQESYHQDRGKWETREVEEAHVRWENRAGRLNRAYQNITTPALDDSAKMQKTLGEFNIKNARPYHPDLLGQAYVRLPDHTPQEAWTEANAAFQKTAADDCMKACAADHLRQFDWKAQMSDLNWTLMLLPVFASYYLDDSGTPQPILIHGQTGQISGARRASTRRAWNTSLIFLMLGIICFLSGLIIENFTGNYPFLGGLSTLLILGGIAGAVGAFFPYLSAWDFNHKNSASS